MKKWSSLLFVLLLLSCTGREKIFRQRVIPFTQILEELKADGPETDQTMELKPYFLPSANRDSLARAYFEYWSANTAAGVQYSDTRFDSVHFSGDTAYAFLSTTWRLPNGEMHRYSNRSQWLLVKGQWYRTLKNGELLSDTQLSH